MGRTRSKPTTLRAVDVATGEYVDGVVSLLPRRRRPLPYGTDYFLAHQVPLLGIALDAELGLQALRVLLLLLYLLRWDNDLPLSPTEVGRILGMARQNVHATLGLLQRKELIVRGESVCGIPTYRLHPRVGWKGDAQGLRAAVSPDALAAQRELVATLLATRRARDTQASQRE